MSANANTFSPDMRALPWSAVNHQATNVYSPRAVPNSRFSDDTLPTSGVTAPGAAAAEGSSDTVYSRWTIGSPRLGGPAVAIASTDEEYNRSKDLLQPRLISPTSVVDSPFERNLKREPSGFPFGAAAAAAASSESNLAPPPITRRPSALTVASSWFDLSDSRDSKHVRRNLNIRRAREASLDDPETDNYHATLAVTNVSARAGRNKMPAAPPVTPVTPAAYQYELKQSYDMPETPLARAPPRAAAAPSPTPSPSQPAENVRATRRSLSTSPFPTPGPCIRPPLIHSMSHGSSETRSTGNGTPGASYTPPAAPPGHTSFLPTSRNKAGRTPESDSEDEGDEDDESESPAASRGRSARPPFIVTTSYTYSAFPQPPPLEGGHLPSSPLSHRQDHHHLHERAPTTDTCGLSSLESSTSNTTNNASLEDFFFGFNHNDDDNDAAYRRPSGTPSQSSETSTMSTKSSTSSIGSAFASATLGVKPKFAKLTATLTKKSGAAAAAAAATATVAGDEAPLREIRSGPQ